MTLARFALFLAVVLGTCNVWAQEGLGSNAANQGGYAGASTGDVGAWSVVPTPPGASYPSAVTPQATQPLSGIDYQQRPGSASSDYLRTGTPTAISGEKLFESTWYVREEYFHWNERYGGADFVDEYGLLLTLGYVKRTGAERFRAELFGGTMNYVGAAQYSDGSTEPLWSRTGYLGLRGEYDLLFEPEWCPGTSFFVGVGTRFWLRDLRDGVTPSDVEVQGYQEMWWTIYPYLGVETTRALASGPEFYSSARIGCTAMTYEFVAWTDPTAAYPTWNDPVLHPKCGITGQVEVGLRGDHFFCAAFSEAMTWGQSAVTRNVLQPASSFVTVGLKTGFTF